MSPPFHNPKSSLYLSSGCILPIMCTLSAETKHQHCQLVHWENGSYIWQVHPLWHKCHQQDAGKRGPFSIQYLGYQFSIKAELEFGCWGKKSVWRSRHQAKHTCLQLNKMTLFSWTIWNIACLQQAIQSTREMPSSLQNLSNPHAE